MRIYCLILLNFKQIVHRKTLKKRPKMILNISNTTSFNFFQYHTAEFFSFFHPLHPFPTQNHNNPVI